MKQALNDPILQENIIKALKKGHTVELKKEKNNLVVVDIERHARCKTPIIG